MVDFFGSLFGFGGRTTTTIEDVTKSTYATIHDFNPLEDSFIVPFAEEGNYNIEVTELTTGAPGFALKYKNNGKTFSEIYFDETLELTDSAIEFYTTSLLQTAMIIEDGSVLYGTGANPVTDNLYDQINASDQSKVDAINGRYMVLGAYAGSYIEDSDVYPGQELHGTHLGDQLVAYQVSGSAFAPEEDDDTDFLFGYGGDDLFLTGGGTNFVFGGESAVSNNYTEYDDSDTVSYFNATRTVVVDLSQTSEDANGNGVFTEVRGAFISANGTESVDKLFSIENIVGGKYDDIITSDDGANKLVGADGNDTLTGGAGDDTFIFNALGRGINIITDFEVGNDVIQISKAGFAESIGIAEQDVVLGQFSFDTTNGALSFNAPQSGSTQFATLENFASLQGFNTNTALQLV